MKILLQKASGSFTIVSSLSICWYPFELYIFSSQFYVAFIGHYSRFSPLFHNTSAFITHFQNISHLSFLPLLLPFFLHLSFLHLSLISTFSPLSLSLMMDDETQSFNCNPESKANLGLSLLFL